MNIRILVLTIIAIIIFPLNFSAAEVKPCNNCALERLVAPASDPILSEPIDYEFSIFEMIHPTLSPKTLKGLSQDEMLAIDTGAAGSGFKYAPGDAAASYEAAGKINEIKYADLDKMILSMPMMQNNTEAVALMPVKEKYGHLLNIIKTNLLFEEGMALGGQTGSVTLQSEDEYNRSHLFTSAVNELLGSVSAEYYRAHPEDKSYAPDFRELALNSVAGEMGLKLETENVLLLKNVDNIVLYTGETSLVMCTIKDDKVTLAEVKNKLSQYLNGGVSYKLFSDAEFIKFMLYEVIFENAYVKHLVKTGAKFDFKPYNEYCVYTVAEGALNNFLDGVTITPQECEKYYNDNPQRFMVKENVEVNYYIFSRSVKNSFEEIIKTGADTAKFQAELKSRGVECETVENERFYAGQLMPEIQKYLFALTPGTYSKIFDIGSADGGAGKCVVFYIKTRSAERKAEMKEIEKLLYRQALADKKSRGAAKMFDELFKKYKVKINLK